MKRNKIIAGFALSLLAISGVASAQTVTFGTPVPASGPAGTVFDVAVNYTAGGSVAAYQVDVQIPPEFTAVTPTNTDGVCAVGNPEATAMRVSDFDGALNPLPSGVVCSIQVTIAAATPLGTYNFSTCAAGACQPPTASDGAGGAVPAFSVDYGSGFTVADVPVPTPPTITAAYAARPGAAGNEGQTVIVGDIDFTVTAPATNGGTGSIVCTDTDAGNPPVLTINPANQAGLTTTVADATVSCALILDTPQAGNVQCVINGAAPQVFAVTCPAGAAIPPVIAPSQPAIIPTNSLWSKLALVGLLAALGLLVVGLRRQQ